MQTCYLQQRQSVTEGGMSVRQAAELHQVPKSTLGDRVSGRVLPGARIGQRVPNKCRRGRAGDLCPV